MDDAAAPDSESWLLRVFAGRDAGSKRHYRSETFLGSSKDADARLRRMLEGKGNSDARMFLNDYLDAWTLANAALPSIRWYDLRHTTASLLLHSGTNPKIVAEKLGHSSVNLTLNVYSHTIPSMQHDAAQTLENALAG